MGRIAASEVPVARCCVRLAQTTCSGTMTKPPPRPSGPPASPPTTPIAASIRRSVRSGGSLRASREAANVKVHDLLIVEEILSRPFEAVLPEHQHVRPLCMAEGLARVLLDPEDRDVGGSDFLDALPDQALELRREARPGLVQDDNGGGHPPPTPPPPPSPPPPPH